MANTRSMLWQPSLLDAGNEPGFDADFTSARHVPLDDTAWVEHVPGWVQGADALFATIVDRAPWAQRRVHMYDRMVDEPRLIAWYGTSLDDPSLPPVIAPMAAALSARYGREFDGVGAALYRDGRDSVAWHGDRIPDEVIDPVVALISLGSRRTLRMRCKSRHGETRAFTFVPGDLFVMGGTAQRTWEHSVPKVANAGPRLSLQFRHSR
ncbi:MAG TPA: alpha-ketoglutarate-dependent dioxygenase AlkB [Acidimicrobiia bacterium]|nr:alpha-ketoglutarate-dependent dioxygenase AlkB [Acidimicrobiia bacterium]